MSWKEVSGMMLTLLLIGTLTVALDVQPAKSEPRAWTMDDNEPAAFRTIQDALKKLISISGWSRYATDSFLLHSADDELSIEYDFFVKNGSVELVVGINESQSDSYAQLTTLIAEYGCKLVKTVSIESRVKAALIDMPFGQLFSFAADTESAALSRYIEPNFKFHTSIVPNDYYWSRQWGPVKIEADEAWNWQIGDPSVLVAVIDTGVDYNHPDLVTNYVPLGYDWVNNDTDPIDDNGHGTHCAGILAGELNNGIGIAGMGQVRVMAEKGLDYDGGGSSVDLANAIVHAVDQGANILSNSWGSPFPSELVHEAVKYAYDHDVLVVAAAGNEASEMKLYPAAYDEVIAVTATDSSDNPAWFTSYGDWVEVAAPGVFIYSTISKIHEPDFNYPYDYLSGTSMSTPCVAGVAALIWSQFPNMTRDEVRLRLRSTTEDLGEPGFDIYYGYGRINARKAAEKAPPSHDLLIWSFEAPLVLEPGKMVLINTTFLNFGENDEENLLVQLLVNGGLVDSKLIDFLVSGALATVNFSWNPTVEDTYNVTSYVKPVIGETITRNNAVSLLVLVKTPKVVKVPEDYSSIQDAVDFADIGDTVQVAVGTYFGRVVVTKSLSIVGEGSSNTTINGIHIAADNVLVSGFTIEYGAPSIVLYHCVGSTLIDIAVHVYRFWLDAHRSLAVYGYTIPEFIHSIDTSNTVDGKPIYYFVNQQGLTINSSSLPEVGYLAIVNSTSINVKNLNLTLEGPLLAYTTHSTVENVSVSDAFIGMTMYSSTNNKIVSNTFSINKTLPLDDPGWRWAKGIDMTHSGGNVVYGNSIVVSRSVTAYEGAYVYGIYLEEGCTANMIRRNTIDGGEIATGVTLSWSTDNALYNNTIFDGEYGILLSSSSNNVLRGNNMRVNYGLVVEGNTVSHFIQNIDTSNVVYERPVYYLVNQRNIIVEPSTFPSIGYLALVNCTNVVVRDLQLTALSDYARILFAFSSHSTIKNVTVSDGQFGILLIESNNNKIIGNNVYGNLRGICLRASDYNQVCNNTLPSNEFDYIYLETSDHNDVCNNMLCAIDEWHNGITAEYSSYNIFWGNRIEGGFCGICAHVSYSVIGKNDISGSEVGVALVYSSYNILSENDIECWGDGFMICFSSNNNLIRRNMISTSWRGFWIAFNCDDNTIYHNNIIYSDTGAEATGRNAWDNCYPSGGNYWSDYNGTDLYSGPYQNETGSDGVGDTPYVIDKNNRDRYPLMSPYPCIHAVAAEDVRLGKTILGQGFATKIHVDIANQGHFIETFNVTVYANATIIDTLVNITLTSGNSTIVIFLWNTTGVAKGNYTITAYATPVPGETDTTDNTLTDGWVVVTILGDTNGDYKVDIQDLVLLVKAFGSHPGHPRWNPNPDLNGDGKVDIIDLVVLIRNFGKSI